MLSRTDHHAVFDVASAKPGPDDVTFSPATDAACERDDAVGIDGPEWPLTRGHDQVETDTASTPTPYRAWQLLRSIEHRRNSDEET